MSISGVSNTYYPMQSAQSTSSGGIKVSEGKRIDDTKELQDLRGLVDLRELPSPMSVADYSEQLQSQGEIKQVAVIKEGNVIVGTISDKGATFFNNSLGSKFNAAGLSVDSNIDAIKSALGGRYDVEVFAHGEGPTYAEVHDSLYSESYNSLVSRQTREYQKEMELSSFGSLLDIEV
ncbi:MAG: hypothetical protein OSB62_01365 [Alphaproteobacteria bacterium]|nr:hypothetical protein [Alphaproteobacteria bacterium]